LYPGLDLDLGTGVAAAAFPPPPAAIQVPGSGFCNLLEYVLHIEVGFFLSCRIRHKPSACIYNWLPGGEGIKGVVEN
jgi:hypothetical protein